MASRRASIASPEEEITLDRIRSDHDGAVNDYRSFCR